jgi:isopenicillin-N N-acyltransferase-like protein
MTRKISKFFIYTFLVLLLCWTWAIDVYHLGCFIPPAHEPVDISSAQKRSLWIPKEKMGINQEVLQGSPFERGLISGNLTKPLLLRQERELVSRLRYFFPSPLVLRPLQVLMMRWFWGADQYFGTEDLQEMDGISRSAPHEFDDLGSGYNRQLYYHGLHEVGQMMVDQSGDDMGCTVAAYPFQSLSGKTSWVIGRNFDFEAGRVFDSEKIVKWIFPNHGNAFVSVIWAGMVGAVTGINENGLYISLNAAGARDFRRYATPTTLVLAHALQYAKNIDDAVEMIKNAETFITDIFVVSDRSSGRFIRIEKSPHHSEIIETHAPTVIANHLVSDYWKNDPINTFRRYDLTSNARVNRGQQLIDKIALDPSQTSRDLDEKILAILRDKGESGGHPLHLGNRNAIDSLIAAHSVIYDENMDTLFVSQGPSLSGAFTGFDLKASFRKHEPVAVFGLKRDPLVTDEMYANVKLASDELSKADRLLRKELKKSSARNCAEASSLLEAAHGQYAESYNYSMTLGDYKACLGDESSARQAWQEAMARVPAYASERRYLEKKLQEK